MRRFLAIVTTVSLLSLPVLADDKKTDPDEIGNRDVGKGLNFYSLEKEIALGKQLAQQVERQAKIIDDPVIAEYVNRVGQNLVRNSDAKVPFTIKVIDTRRRERVRAAGRILLRELRADSEGGYGSGAGGRDGA